MLSGEYIRGLQNIHSYPKEPIDPMEGVDLSFLDNT